MKKVLILVALSCLLTSCASLSKQVIDDIPDPYKSSVSPALIKSYFLSSRAPHGWQYKDVQIDGNKVFAIVADGFINRARVIAEVLSDNGQRRIDISMSTDGFLYFPSTDDTEIVRRDLAQFIFRGR